MYGIKARFGYEFTEQFIARVEATSGKTAAGIAEEAMRQINNAEERIRVNLRWLRDKCDAIEGSLDRSQNLNELGEFQGNGAGEIDRYCTIRYYMWQMLAGAVPRDALKELQEYRNE